jgi:AcrR family transcriptional regulator
MSDPFGRLLGMKKLHMPRIQITRAAVLLYAAEGPKGLTMRALGRTLGVCAAALYRHFKNKDAIVEAVVNAAEERLAKQLRPSPRLRPPRDRAAAMAERALQFSIASPHLFQLVTRRKAHWQDQYGGRRALVMRDQIATAMREGQLKPDDPEPVSSSLWAQICGLVALRERGELPLGGQPLEAAWLGSARRMVAGIAA